jgi:hypothetical protein
MFFRTFGFPIPLPLYGRAAAWRVDDGQMHEEAARGR